MKFRARLISALALQDTLEIIARSRLAHPNLVLTTEFALLMKILSLVFAQLGTQDKVPDMNYY